MSHSHIGFGMGIVATIAHKAGHDVKVVDNNTLYRFYRDKDIFRVLKSYKPDVLAYCITIHNAYATYRQIAQFKVAFPKLMIIAGGVHMKQAFCEALRHGVDVVVNREGEKVILPLLRHLEERGKERLKEQLESVPGVSFIEKDGNFHLAKEFPSLENLDEVPVVDYELFNIKDFIKTRNEPGVFILTGQRGCPFRCTFCSDEFQRADTRAASADWLFKNVSNVYEKYKVGYLVIGDNNFTLSRQRAVEFCEKIIKSGLGKKIAISCQSSTRFPIDEELISLMKKAGFCRINFGLERLTPYSLKLINKEQPLERVNRDIALVAKYGIDPAIFMMIGFPFETKELLQEEKKLFLGLKKYSRKLFLSILCPTPGTIYYDNNPKIKEWYLNKKESLMLSAYFTNVLDMHTSHTIKKNFFDFSSDIQQSLMDYYLFFKKLNYGTVFTKRNFILSFCLKLDFLIAKLSQTAFAVSPLLEFILFDRLKAIRFYWGSYFFGRSVFNKD